MTTEGAADFQEIGGREAYYIGKEKQINETADLLKDVEGAFKSMKDSVQKGGATYLNLSRIVGNESENLHKAFNKFDSRAMFLNEQPKRVLAGGENLRLEIKKLNYKITTLEDDLSDLNRDHEKLIEESKRREDVLMQEIDEYKELTQFLKTQTIKAFSIAEFAATLKSNLECTAEFWGIWRSEFVKDKIAELLFEIKQQAMLIDKLRKGKRLKTKETLARMKAIANYYLKERYFRLLIEHVNWSLAVAHAEAKEKEIATLKKEIAKRDAKIEEQAKHIEVLEIAQADNTALLKRVNDLTEKSENDDRRISELEEDLDATETELAQVKHEYTAFQKEVARDRADSTDYKGLAQKYAKRFVSENQERVKYMTKLHILATPEEMEQLVRQDEYDKIVLRLAEYDKMFEYLKQEMSNAENYKGQIAELKLVLRQANKNLVAMSDLKVRNAKIEEALDIVEGEGIQGLTQKWLSATNEMRTLKLENSRRLEEIENLRRQRHIFKLNYESEVTAHIATCYRALSISATVDERDVMAELGIEKPMFDGEIDYLAEKQDDLKQWLQGYIAEEQVFIENRKDNQKQMEEAAKSFHNKAADMLKEPPGMKRIKQDYLGSKGIKVPFDTGNMLYRNTAKPRKTSGYGQAPRPMPTPFNRPPSTPSQLSQSRPGSSQMSTRRKKPGVMQDGDTMFIPAANFRAGSASRRTPAKTPTSPKPIRHCGVEEDDENVVFRVIREHEKGYPLDRIEKGKRSSMDIAADALNVQEYEEASPEKRIEREEHLSPEVPKLSKLQLHKHYPDLARDEQRERNKQSDIEQTFIKSSRALDEMIKGTPVLPKHYVPKQWKP